MPTLIASGTVTADGTEQTLAEDTSNKNYVLRVDLSTLINGETVMLRLYTKCLTGGTAVLEDEVVYVNAQGAPAKRSIPIPADIYIKATLQQTVYVTAYKAFPWALLSLA